MDKINTVVVDDHSGDLEAMVNQLKPHPQLFTLFTASHGKEFFELQKKTPQPIHLVITDIHMPLMGGLELMAELKLQNHPAKILALSHGYSTETLSKMKEMGQQYLGPKNMVLLPSLIEICLSGKTLADYPEIYSQWDYNSHRYNLSQYDILENKLGFNNRELKVMSYLHLGKSTKEIGLILNLSASSIQKIKSEIVVKAGLVQSSQIAAWAIKNNLIR